jgi:hypothetical protein
VPLLGTRGITVATVSARAVGDGPRRAIRPRGISVGLSGINLLARNSCGERLTSETRGFGLLDLQIRDERDHHINELTWSIGRGHLALLELEVVSKVGTNPLDA